MPTPLTVRYAPNGGKAQLEVDGKDLSEHVGRVTIDHHGGSLAQVYLELSPKADLDEVLVEGMVHVKETVHEDPADATLRFLDPIDPAEFEKAVLSAMELGGPQTFGAAALHVLRGYAGGKP